LVRRLEKAEGGSDFFPGKLKEDIAILREQNMQLRTELGEKSNGVRRVDIYRKEELMGQYKEKVNILRNQLFSTQNVCKSLQEKQELCVSELRALVEHTEELINRENINEKDKENLNSLLTRLTNERNELIFRMNTLTEQYNKYVQEMIQERKDINITNKNRQKMLACSILVEKLRKEKANRLRAGLKSIKVTADYIKEIHMRIIELGKWQEDYKQKLVSLAFQRWKHNEIKWIRERRLNEVLMEREHLRRQRAMVFAKWQTNFRSVAKKRDTQTEVCYRINELLVKQQEKNLRIAFGLWYKFTSKEFERDLRLKRILLKLIKRYELIAFTGWLSTTKQLREEYQLTLLGMETAEEKFKRQMFARLRHNINLEEDMKIGQAQLVLDTSHKNKQKARYIKNSTIILMAMNRKHNKQLEKEALNSIKLNLLNKRKKRADEVLKKELPEVEVLEKALKAENENQEERSKKAILNIAFITLKRNLRYSIERWRNAIPVYIQNTIRLKRILKRFTVNKIGTAFNSWRYNVHKKKVKQNQVELGGHDKRMETLDEIINELGVELNRHKQHMKDYTLLKLEKIIHRISRRYMHNKILQWKRITIALNDIEIAGEKMNKLVKRHVMRNGLERFRRWNRMEKMLICFNNKIKAIKDLAERNTKKVALRTFVLQVNLIKEIKNGLRKFFRDKDNDNLRNYLNKWRNKTYVIAKELIVVETEKLIESNEAVNRDIEISERSKRNLADKIKDIEKHEHNKALLAISKNFLVHYNNRMRIAFNIWQYNTYRSNTLTKLLIRYIKKKEHIAYRLGLANWRTNKHAEHLNTLKEELHQHIKKHDTFSKITILKLTETEGELKDLKEGFVAAKNKHEVNTKKVEAIAEVLKRMHREYKELPVSHNYLLNWNNMVQKEKNLQRKIMQTMQTFTGNYIYAKLKQISQENDMRNKIQAKCTKLFNIIKRHWLRKGFTNMRLARRTHAEQEQNIDEQGQEAVLKQVQDKLEVIHEHSRVSNEKELVRRRLLKNFLAWRKEIKFQKLLKHQTEVLNEEIKFIRINGSFNRWHNDFSFIMRDKENMDNAAKHHTELLLNKALHSWYKLYKSEVTLPKVLDKIAKRQCVYNIGYAMERLNADIGQKSQNKQSNKDTALLKFTVLLRTTMTNVLTDFSNTLIQYGTKRKLDREQIGRVLLKLFLRNLSNAFERWREKAEEKKLVEEIEFKGKTANKVQQLAKKHASTKELISNYKLENVHRANSSLRIIPTRISEPIEVKEELIIENQPKGDEKVSIDDVSSVIHLEDNKDIQGSVLEFSYSFKRQQQFEGNERKLRKFMLKWIRRVENKELKGTYINMWLNIIKLKKSIRISSDFILKRLSFGDKAWAFDKLKNLKRAGLKTYERTTRPQLLKQ